MRWMLPCALALLVACDESDPGGLPSKHVAVHLEPASIGGVDSELTVRHYPETSFGQITTVYPEDSFADAVVAGKSFDGFSEVYVLSLEVHNETDRAVQVPDLLVRSPETMDGEPDVRFRPRQRTLAPQSSLLLRYFWDPGRPFSTLNARLAWSP